MTIILLWAVALVLFVGIDMLWLIWLGRGFYVSEIGGLLREQPDIAAAALFYILYAAGLVIFVLKAAHSADSMAQAMIYGALFGLVAYGTYDLTNMAVADGFTWKIAVIDMAWGSALTAVTSVLTIWIARLVPG